MFFEARCDNASCHTASNSSQPVSLLNTTVSAA